MDSLSQAALGSAVGIAVMGRRTAVWKAALIGAAFGTLPDLDAFIDHGDPIRNMTFHRAASHSLLYLTLLSPVLAWLTSKLSGGKQDFKHWLTAIWLILITHVLLDFMTIYGTQMAIPFTDYPFGVGSIFIIDPLYTLPLHELGQLAHFRRQLAKADAFPAGDGTKRGNDIVVSR